MSLRVVELSLGLGLLVSVLGGLAFPEGEYRALLVLWHLLADLFSLLYSLLLSTFVGLFEAFVLLGSADLD